MTGTEMLWNAMQKDFMRVVQHECDHLSGILYLMRMRDFTHLDLRKCSFRRWIRISTIECFQLESVQSREPVVQQTPSGPSREKVAPLPATPMISWLFFQYWYW